LSSSAESPQEHRSPLALTPGAEALRPPIPGIDLPGVHVLRRMGDMDQIKAQLDALLADAAAERRGPVRAVVIGAGYIGLEMAENLRRRGAEVDVVELADQILPAIDHELSVPVESHLRSRGVAVHLHTGAAALREASGGLDVELTNHTVLHADLVILSAGVRPNTQLARDAGLELGERGGIVVDTHMRTSDSHIWAAGDAVETPNTVLPGSWIAPLAGPANRQARVAAENICGRDTEYRSTQGTSIVKVFDMVAGGTGATQRQLKAAGVPHRAIHVHPSGHAGYYPGTAMMHLKVVFDPETGRVLGGQAAGFDGVDKRIDVLATAVRMGMTVFDLEELELAYAPPFGSAKDPINMAGFVAANVVRGDLSLWYAEDYPAAVEGAGIIDVRTAEEFGIWHLPGAENVPLDTLRAACAEWDTSTPIRLYCAVGFRSCLAYRALRQRGFTDLQTLSGGSTTFRAWHQLDEADAPVQRAPMENYAETHSLFALAPAGIGASIDLDVTGLACPGPIMKLAEAANSADAGDEITIHVSDPGFAADAPAWVKRNGHELVSIEPEGPGYVAVIRKGGAGTVASARPVGGATVSGPGKNSFVVFSGDLDKVLASMIIANGALAMGEQVLMFFTFWASPRATSSTVSSWAVSRPFSARHQSRPRPCSSSAGDLASGHERRRRRGSRRDSAGRHADPIRLRDAYPAAGRARRHGAHGAGLPVRHRRHGFHPAGRARTALRRCRSGALVRRGRGAAQRVPLADHRSALPLGRARRRRGGRHLPAVPRARARAVVARSAARALHRGLSRRDRSGYWLHPHSCAPPCAPH